MMIFRYLLLIFKLRRFWRVVILLVFVLTTHVTLRSDTFRTVPILDIYQYSQAMRGHVENQLVDVDWDGERVTIRIRRRENYVDRWAHPKVEAACVRQRSGGLIPWDRYSVDKDYVCEAAVEIGIQ
jgi:hypothetical protein